MIIVTVVPVFLIILAGYLLGRFKRISIEPYINLIVYITAPCLIFASISRSDIDLSDFMTIALAAVGIILALTLLVFLILKIAKSDMKGLYLPMVVGNTGYMGYPIALFAFGIAGLSRAVVFDMMNSLFLFSFGIYIIHKKNSIREAFRIPLIYAVIGGLIFSLLKIPVHEILFKPVQTIGQITIPLALMVLGYKLTEIRLKKIRIAVLASLFRIVGGFIIALSVISLFSIEGLARNIILIQASMPSAVMSMILTAKYRKDAALVSSIVLLTTILSLVAIPMILWFVS